MFNVKIARLHYENDLMCSTRNECKFQQRVYASPFFIWKNCYSECIWIYITKSCIV